MGGEPVTTKPKRPSTHLPWEEADNGFVGHPDPQALPRAVALPLPPEIALSPDLAPLALAEAAHHAPSPLSLTAPARHAFYAQMPPLPSGHRGALTLLSGWAASPHTARGLQIAAAGAFRLPRPPDHPGEEDEDDPLGRSMRELLRMLHAHTQKDHKGDRTLYRPLFKGKAAAGQVRLLLNPLSSWTAHEDVARDEAHRGGGTAIVMMIAPAPQILAAPGSPFTYPHSGADGEHIVLGRVSRGLVLPLHPSPNDEPQGRQRMTDDEPILRPDDDIENADWLRARSWAIQPPSAQGLLDALGVGDASPQTQRSAVQHFLTLPAARAMPASVRVSLMHSGLLTPYDGVQVDPQTGDLPEEPQEPQGFDGLGN